LSQLLVLGYRQRSSKEGTVLNPHELPISDRPVENATYRVSTLRLWASLALAVHVMLAFSWLATSWAPWIKPQREMQFLVSMLGAVVHGWMIRQSMRDVRNSLFGLSRFFALPYLLASVVLYLLTFYVTSSMIYRDEVRYKIHLDHVKKIHNQHDAIVN
jgi:small-conductance mechanosensitive channel